ncbi:hypothetical protein Tco_0483421 [Tanacetum coccineum]
MERKMDEWEKSQNISSEQTVYLGNMEGNGLEEYGNGKGWGGKSDDSLKNQKVPPPPIIVNNKSKKD